jgi:RHH-type transcriptional regulator, proline utilization regulon repressor / proline dehydrogenase / delta 1-pyrroline-5-carboxylate dehydrogenase
LELAAWRDYFGSMQERPFAAFLGETIRQAGARRAITEAYRRPEPECVAALLAGAALTPEQGRAVRARAEKLVTKLRAKHRPSGIEALIHEYSLSSTEGIALMCLAEALLRIPDNETRDALIRDQLARGDWRAHLGRSPSLFVNAATWGLMMSERLLEATPQAALAQASVNLLSRGGEPLIRKGVDLAMRLMGEQFVLGKTIDQALSRAAIMEAKGFRYSYDMLGEAALTADEAARYGAAYEEAIIAIGAVAKGENLYDRPGISIKLSALHPRYTRSQRDRVLAELSPRLIALSELARARNLGLNIDAEEAERLDLSLDLLEILCRHPAFSGWDGLGFVIQAYQKRAPLVLDHVIDLARRTGHRLMLRLVKGAYWDAEIKRAQCDGVADFPVFTRKAHTDLSYLACARKLLAAGPAVYPQFATHNALTLASVEVMAADYPASRYEFQCLHGMGEALYETAMAETLAAPCRIYAPVGTHETLLAYLVRRLLENGANSSFINRLGDVSAPLDEVLADPVAQVRAHQPVGGSHEKIALPPKLFAPERENSRGFDFSDENALRQMAEALALAPSPGAMRAATAHDVERAFRVTQDLAPWPLPARQAVLQRAAELLETNRSRLMAVLVTEACKTLPDAAAEIREAVDFLRYYAAQTSGWSDETHRPLGTVVCISPWNFPLAIFVGQVAAALAAGNDVLAKPAEETPCIAALAVALLHEAGTPRERLHCLQGQGEVGAALVADPRCDGVVFTGSTEVARQINQLLAMRTDRHGRPIPLIAETGGLNAMLVDSSALPEQVITDVLYSAFNSAGQRCSALRLLCVQEDIAPHLLARLGAAMAELRVGPPDRLGTDIGPVISAGAAQKITAYIAAMRAAGYPIVQHETFPGEAFVPPTLIEIPSITVLREEIFGPVLHVLRYPPHRRDALLEAINRTGYALTFGLHSRIDEAVAQVASKIAAGNIYVNRNMVGAVVGVQPFGGQGLSGTGPKAGGPLYLHRMLAAAPFFVPETRELAGPVGERNFYELRPRGTVLCRSRSERGLEAQRAAAEQSGCKISHDMAEPFDAVLFEGEAEEVRAFNQFLAARPGAILPFQALSTAALGEGAIYNPAWLLAERVVSINTAAVGGNASLMMLE